MRDDFLYLDVCKYHLWMRTRFWQDKEHIVVGLDKFSQIWSAYSPREWLRPDVWIVIKPLTLIVVQMVKYSCYVNPVSHAKKYLIE